MHSSPWVPSAGILSIPPDEIHIWRATLNLSGGDLERLRSVLSPDEQERAVRFRFAEHQRRFIAARGILRDILSRYVRRQPAELEFCYSRFGKPALAGDPCETQIRFNLSHCSDLAVYAIARDREVGIDLELVRPEMAGEHIAKRFFSPREVSTLLALPLPLQPEAFFNCWTRKEAYVKALGMGLQVPLESFDVSLAPGEPAALLGSAGSRWALRAFEPAPAYVAAVAAEGDDWHTRTWQWQVIPAQCS